MWNRWGGGDAPHTPLPPIGPGLNFDIYFVPLECTIRSDCGEVMKFHPSRTPSVSVGLQWLTADGAVSCGKIYRRVDGSRMLLKILLIFYLDLYWYKILTVSH